MRFLFGVIFVGLLIRAGFADCNDASIAHPKSIFIEVNLSGSIVGPPFAPEDLQPAEEKVGEHVIESLMSERRNLSALNSVRVSEVSASISCNW